MIRRGKIRPRFSIQVSRLSLCSLRSLAANFGFGVNPLCGWASPEFSHKERKEHRDSGACSPGFSRSGERRSDAPPRLFDEGPPEGGTTCAPLFSALPVLSVVNPNSEIALPQENAKRGAEE